MDQVRYGIVVRWHVRVFIVCFLFIQVKLALFHKIFHGGISRCYIICFYTLPVTDAAACAPASSSQPSTTTQTAEKSSSHVVGMYITIIIHVSLYVKIGFRYI